MRLIANHFSMHFHLFFVFMHFICGGFPFNRRISILYLESGMKVVKWPWPLLYAPFMIYGFTILQCIEMRVGIVKWSLLHMEIDYQFTHTANKSMRCIENCCSNRFFPGAFLPKMHIFFRVVAKSIRGKKIHKSCWKMWRKKLFPSHRDIEYWSESDNVQRKIAYSLNIFHLLIATFWKRVSFWCFAGNALHIVLHMSGKCVFRWLAHKWQLKCMPEESPIWHYEFKE